MIMKYTCFFVNLKKLVSPAWQTICIDFVIQNGLLMPCLLREIIWYNNFPLQKKIIVFENFWGWVAPSPIPLPPDSMALKIKISIVAVAAYPVDTGRKLNVHKTFRRRPGHVLTEYLFITTRNKEPFPRKHTFKIF